MAKILLALDFDHTVVDDNTDTHVMKLSFGGKLPEEVKALRKDGKWTDYMNEVFEYLHKQCGVLKKDYEENLSEIPLTQGFSDLFKFVRENVEFTDCIIVSDSNSWFIDFILSLYQFRDIPSEIFTNDARFDQDGVLRITPHHNHEHEVCPINLCKTKVLKEFIVSRKAQGVTYDHICYVGDGGNDYCPAMSLSKCDTLFARKGYALQRKLRKMQEENDSSEFLTKCKVIIWENGQEILFNMGKLLGK